MDRLAAYNKLNRSFKKKYIFSFGAEGGFYSEFNNMVFGIIYCLKYEYRFILYSNNSKFKVKHGWEDFFEPFCDTIGSSAFHKKFNTRETAPKVKLKYYPWWYLFKQFNRETYLTHQLFHAFFNKDFAKEQFDIPALGLKGNLWDVSREIVKMIYRFNGATQTEIQTAIAQLNLPPRYVSLHIRRGDKDTEFKFMPTDAYLTKLKELSDLRDVFVFTDDYTEIEDLRKNYPNLNFYALVNPDERGYIHADFIKLNVQKRKTAIIKMLASLEIMRGSELAIGTYTTNPGMFLGMTMPENKFVSVQKSSWYQFEKDDVKNYAVK